MPTVYTHKQLTQALFNIHLHQLQHLVLVEIAPYQVDTRGPPQQRHVNKMIPWPFQLFRDVLSHEIVI